MSQVIVECPDCSDEVEFNTSEGGLNNSYYLDEDGDAISLTLMQQLDGRSKDCPRCGRTIQLKMTAALKAA